MQFNLLSTVSAVFVLMANSLSVRIFMVVGLVSALRQFIASVIAWISAAEPLCGSVGGERFQSTEFLSEL